MASKFMVQGVEVEMELGAVVRVGGVGWIWGEDKGGGGGSRSSGRIRSSVRTGGEGAATYWKITWSPFQRSVLHNEVQPMVDCTLFCRTQRWKGQQCCLPRCTLALEVVLAADSDGVEVLA